MNEVWHARNGIVARGRARMGESGLGAVGLGTDQQQGRRVDMAQIMQPGVR